MSGYEAMIEEVRFAEDSPLEGGGFEPSVPRMRPIAVSREDMSLIRGLAGHSGSATPGKPFRKSGTDGSNPLSSSGESSANLTSSIIAS